jgi:16S rRNA (guanine527-N7)-methyltransferase
MMTVLFAQELTRVLPADLPHRDEFIVKAAMHLDLIVETNRLFNLTRIIDPRESVIKHVVDSVLPWRHFAHAAQVVDAGTGAGFPGIPLALVLPGTRFTLLDSTQKKARFAQSVVDALGLKNVEVLSQRAEDWLKTHNADILTARAVAPIDRSIPMFAPTLRKSGSILLYKGPDVETEFAAAAAEARKRQIRMRVIDRYQLPDEFGSRTLVELSRSARRLTSQDDSGTSSDSVGIFRSL